MNTTKKVITDDYLCKVLRKTSSGEVLKGYGPHLTYDGYDADALRLNDMQAVFNFLLKLPAIIGMQRLTQPYVISYDGAAPASGVPAVPRDDDGRRDRQLPEAPIGHEERQAAVPDGPAVILRRRDPVHTAMETSSARHRDVRRARRGDSPGALLRQRARLQGRAEAGAVVTYSIPQ